MSVDTPGEEVQDDGLVDRKLKNRIITARQRVDDREDELFVRSISSQIGFNRQQAVAAWGATVRQYLRAIEPILRQEEVEESEYYYKDVPIAVEAVTPQPGVTRVLNPRSGKSETEHINWNLYYSEEVNPIGLVKHNGYDINPPEPKTIELYGLKSVIETDAVRKRWEVPLGKGVLNKVAVPTFETPLKKSWLETAVREADHFLQQAGVGLEIGSTPHGTT